jgi:uncharacterized protein YcbX
MIAIHKRLTQNVISNMRSTNPHGGIHRQRTHAEEKDVAAATAKNKIQIWEEKLTHENWKFTSDDDISKYLLCETYLSGVRRNGIGFLTTIGIGGFDGANSVNGGCILKREVFKGMIVS